VAWVLRVFCCKCPHGDPQDWGGDGINRKVFGHWLCLSWPRREWVRFLFHVWVFLYWRPCSSSLRWVHNGCVAYSKCCPPHNYIPTLGVIFSVFVCYVRCSAFVLPLNRSFILIVLSWVSPFVECLWWISLGPPCSL